MLEPRPRYKQHHPETTALHAIVREHLESFLDYSQKRTTKRLPRYVEAEFRRYLECGVPAFGFARARCPSCGHDLFVAFSCKLRGLCPSCNARRMCDTAAHLTDHVLPDVRLRQWVLSVPFELRLLLATTPKALSSVGRIFCREIIRWQRKRAAVLGLERTEGGAICFVQRFGGSLNLNVHYHVAVPDAVFRKVCDSDSVGHGLQAEVIPLPGPTKSDVDEIATSVAAKVRRWLERNGYLGAKRIESGERNKSTPLERCLAGSLGIGQLVIAPSRNNETKPPARELPKPKKGLVGACGKFDIHAGVSIGAGCPQARERLLRYCARAPLSLERLRVLDDGRIAYEVRHAFGKQPKLRIMTPMQFMARLAALIPPPRHPLVRYHGVFAPNSKWRSAVVPRREPETGEQASTDNECCDGALAKSAPIASAATESAREVALAERNARTNGVPPPESAATTNHPSPKIRRREPSAVSRIDWATLLKRVHDVDPLECPNCGDRMRFVELVEDREVAREVLLAEGLPSNPPPLARARAPDWDED